MIAVLDHKDSFTYNLVHMLQLEDQVQVFDQEEAFRLDPSLFSTLVFSPGPGQPEDYPASIQLYQKARGHIAILCLLYTSPSPRDYAASRMPSSA